MMFSEFMWLFKLNDFMITILTLTINVIITDMLIPVYVFNLIIYLFTLFILLKVLLKLTNLTFQKDYLCCIEFLRTYSHA